MLNFCVVALSLTKNSIYAAYSRIYKLYIIINLIIWSQWCKERFIINFTFQLWFNPLRISVATLLWRKTPEFTLQKTENNKKKQRYKMFEKVKTKLEKHATGTCT